MEKIRDFRDLEIWQIGNRLVQKVYEVVASFPKEELYGLVSQIKAAVLSVPANIAEGSGRFHYMERSKFYLNARGSLYELKSHLLIAKELGFINQNSEQLFSEIENLSVKLNNLITLTRRKAHETP